MAQSLRRLYPTSTTYLVAVTADAFEQTCRQCMAAGFDAWLSKPFRVEDIKEVLQRCQAALASGAEPSLVVCSRELQ